MKRSALNQLACSATRLVCCVLLANVALMASPLLAAQPQEVRLFHEPLNSVVTDEQIVKLNQSQATLSEPSQSKNQSDKNKSELELADAADTVAKSADVPRTGEGATYQYNGFVSTASGKHYFINGLPLGGIDSLVLVSVKLEGRSLVLKTPNGPTFELSVGQSISKDSL